MASNLLVPGLQVMDEKQLAEAAAAGASQEEQEQDNKALEVSHGGKRQL
jgi:hypothetical protein